MLVLSLYFRGSDVLLVFNLVFIYFSILVSIQLIHAPFLNLTSYFSCLSQELFALLSVNCWENGGMTMMLYKNWKMSIQIIPVVNLLSLLQF